MNTIQTANTLKRIGPPVVLVCLLGLIADSFAGASDVEGRLNSGRPLERLQALTEISEFADQRYADAVVLSLHDSDESVRLRAVSTLAALPSSSRVRDTLIRALGDEVSRRVRMKVACELARSYPTYAAIPLLQRLATEIDRGEDIVAAMQASNSELTRRQGIGEDCPVGMSPASEVQLIAGRLSLLKNDVTRRELGSFLQDRRPQMRWIAATLIADSAPDAAQNIALAAVWTDDLAVVAGTHKSLIRMGNPDFVPVLLNALDVYGTPSMAAAYIASEQQSLIDGAEIWASSRGYRGFVSSRKPSLLWGSGRVH